MKKRLRIGVMLVFKLCLLQAQTPVPINAEDLLGSNCHLPDTLGRKTNLGGKIDSIWLTPGNKIWEVNSHNMRLGGINCEQECQIDGNPNIIGSNIQLTIADYVRKTKRMRSNSIEPRLTIPVLYGHGTVTPLGTRGDVASQAWKMVNGVNNALAALTPSQAPVTDWVIGNEFEDGGKYTDGGTQTVTIHGYDGVDAARRIYFDIRQIHDSVVAHWNAASPPRFIGPELYSFDNYDHDGAANNKVDSLMYQLTGKWCQLHNNATVDSFNILPYIDIFTVHYYPFGDESANLTNQPGGDFLQASRSNVINTLRNPVPAAANTNTYNVSSLEANIRQLINPTTPSQGLISDWNANNAHQVSLAITEANICHINDVAGASGISDAMDLTVSGTSANGFVSGQFLAEMMGICMEYKVGLNFWSTLEGSASNSFKNDIGFLSRQNLGQRRSTFHHFKMIANNFRGDYMRGSYNHNSATPAYTFSNGIKSFAAAQPAGVKVIIMNQNENAYNYQVRFDGSTGTTTNQIVLSYPAMSTMPCFSTSPGFTNTVYNSTTTIPARSTVLLTFDCHGDIFTKVVYQESDSMPHLRQVKDVEITPDMISCDLLGSIGVGGTIPTSTVISNYTMFISSDIAIPAGVAVTFSNSVLIFGPGVGVYGSNGSKLKLKDVVMLGCDGEMWAGIDMDGGWGSEDLWIENSYIVNATNGVKAYRVPTVYIKNSVIANGDENAIELSQCKSYTVSECLLGGYLTGIKTNQTEPNFKQEIYANKIVEVDYALKFEAGGMDSCSILCNDLRFKRYGIHAEATSLPDFGTPTLSSGNRFVKTSEISPADYLFETAGSPTFYYGASQAGEFGAFTVMNITATQATNERACPATFDTPCPDWLPERVGLDEAVKLANQIIVYPNPSSGTFNLKYEAGIGNYVLNVHDVMGRLIINRNVDLTNDKTINFDLTTKGIYVVSLTDEKNRFTQKIIVE